MTNPEPTCSPATRGDPDAIDAAIRALDASGRRAIRQLTAAMLGALVALALVTSGTGPAFLRRLRYSR